MKRLKLANNRNYKSSDNGYEIRFEEYPSNEIISGTVVCYNEGNEFREDFEFSTDEDATMLIDDIEECLLRRSNNIEETKQVITKRHAEWCEFLGIDPSYETFMEQYDMY